ncbi:hypothetical protein WA026_017689 [Henosepilachna vigintioctopunctata]|uniref:Uncharacterized protein n=1 Tax=Henosepilachna vigintioctopunctata TaxID=420089 RepID=A0AAW1U9E3_9CUCU
MKNIKNRSLKEIEAEEVIKLVKECWPKVVHDAKQDDCSIANPELVGDTIIVANLNKCAKILNLRKILGTQRSLFNFIREEKLGKGQIASCKPEGWEMDGCKQCDEGLFMMGIMDGEDTDIAEIYRICRRIAKRLDRE